MLGLSAEEFGFVLSALAFALVSFLGGKAGKDALVKRNGPAAAPDGVMEVAGAIVSDKAVDRMVKSMDAFTSASVLLTAAIDKDVEAKAKLTAMVEKHGRHLGDNTAACEDMGRNIQRVDAHIGKLVTELYLQRELSDRGGK